MEEAAGEMLDDATVQALKVSCDSQFLNIAREVEDSHPWIYTFWVKTIPNTLKFMASDIFIHAFRVLHNIISDFDLAAKL